MPLLPDDLVSRCLIYDRFFPGNVHVDAVLFQFDGGTKSDGALHESGVLRRLAPLDTDVHRIGCKTAAKQNARRGEPPSGPGRRYYVAFRTALLSAMALEDDGYRIEIAEVEEDGEKAHLDIALFLLVEGRSAKSVWRAAAGLALAEAFGPATTHICQSDANDEQHPIRKFGVECLLPGMVDRWPSPVLLREASSGDWP